MAHAIEAHRFRAGPAPATLEAQAVFDADKLDITGAIGVARAFAYAGEHGSALWNTPWRDIARGGRRCREPAESARRGLHAQP